MASGIIVLFLRQEERRHGIVDTVPELFLDAQVVGAVCKLLDGKGETHIRTPLVGLKGKPTVHVQDILVPVPIHLVEDMTTPT